MGGGKNPFYQLLNLANINNRQRLKRWGLEGGRYGGPSSLYMTVVGVVFKFSAISSMFPAGILFINCPVCSVERSQFEHASNRKFFWAAQLLRDQITRPNGLIR